MRWLWPILLLAGCAAPVGSGYTVTAEFTDVLDLVPYAAVRVNDVTVGSVTGIGLQGFTAVVTLRVQAHVDLPDNALAEIRQSSLLGEKFVALARPDDPSGRLSDGDRIGLDRTRRGAEVEEVLAALGLLLNGGGLAQLKTINQEVVKALSGRSEDARGTLRALERFVSSLDRQSADIVRAIEALDRLAADLAAQADTVGRAVDALAPGLTVLATQRPQLTAALTALHDLSTVGQRVINASRDDTVASLRALQPTLERLVEAGDAFPKALDFALSYPFPPNVRQAITGDFVRLHATLDLDAATILANLLAKGGPGGLPPVVPPTLPPLPLPSLPPLPLPTALPSALPSPAVVLPSLPVHLGQSDSSTGEVAGVRGNLLAILTGGAQ